MADKALTIIRTPRGANRPYFATARDTPQDNRLSWEARGVLWYLLSKPDDWEVQITDIMKQGDIGRDKAKRILKELRDNRYITTETMRDPETGQFIGKVDRVYEIPVNHYENTEVLKTRLTDNQDTGKPQLHNTDIQSTDKTKTPTPSGADVLQVDAIKPLILQALSNGGPANTTELRKRLPRNAHKHMMLARNALIATGDVIDNGAVYALPGQVDDDVVDVVQALQAAERVEAEAMTEAQRVIRSIWGTAGEAANDYERLFGWRPGARGAWKQYQIQGLSPADVEAWARWHRAQRPQDQIMVARPQSINGSVSAWIEAGKPNPGSAVNPLSGLRFVA